MSQRRSRWLWLGVAWLLTSGLALAAGFAALLAVLVARSGALPEGLPLQVGWMLVRTVWLEALLPLWLATLACWLVLVRLAPRLDASWRTLVPGIALTAALCFAPVGAWSFVDWQPTGPRDVVYTLLLCAGGVSAALWLPRRLWPRLAPGVFTRPVVPG